MVVLKTNTNLQFVWNKTEHACAICSTPIVIKISVTTDPNFIQVRTNVCQNVLAAGRTYFCFGRNTIRIILSLIFSKQTDKITPIQPIPTPVQHSSSHTYTHSHTFLRYYFIGSVDRSAELPSGSVLVERCYSFAWQRCTIPVMWYPSVCPSALVYWYWTNKS